MNGQPLSPGQLHLPGRTNAEGIRQPGGLLEPLGRVTVDVPVTTVLHLKSAVTALPDRSRPPGATWSADGRFPGAKITIQDQERKLRERS